MADFATAPLSRDQLVLFPERLDSAIAPDHAVRQDPSVPVPAEDMARLPTTTTKKQDGTTTTTFNKTAFVYDAEADVYWCPAGSGYAQVTMHRSRTVRTLPVGLDVLERQREASSGRS
jgi:hypothetical protein